MKNVTREPKKGKESEKDAGMERCVDGVVLRRFEGSRKRV